MKVILMGYMGSGKSTIGKELAGVLDYDFIDLDDYIAKSEKMSIPEIFDNKGEIYFRKKEHYYLERLLERNNDLVLSLGGGTPCYGNNMQTILNTKLTKNFYLKGSIKFLSDRLFEEKENRPLIRHLKQVEELEEYIGKHLFERRFYYNQASGRIDIDNKTKKDLVEEIIFNLI